MIEGLTTSGSLPTLERLMQFTGQRHRIIAHNIANLSTPGFKSTDLSVATFQKNLREMIDAQRSAKHRDDLISDAMPALNAQLNAPSRRESSNFAPEPIEENVLFHDGSDRNIERTMQNLVENFMTFRAASQLFKSRVDALNVAVRERI